MWFTSTLLMVENLNFGTETLEIIYEPQNLMHTRLSCNFWIVEMRNIALGEPNFIYQLSYGAHNISNQSWLRNL